MRLDKFVNDMTGIGRSAIKKEIRCGKVCVNGTVVKAGDMQIDPEQDTVVYQDRKLQYVRHHYYLLHKPAGVVSAVKDAKDPTVMDLLEDTVPEHVRNRLFPVGRLDKDAEGLLLLTDDGELSHVLLSPAHHVERTYYCLLAHGLEEADIKRLETGVDIGEKHLTRPAAVNRLSETEIELTVTEGKFHQVKRMLAAVNNRVVYLKRIRMGHLAMPADLTKGSCIALTEDEAKRLKA